jgi:hypothetical protein
VKRIAVVCPSAWDQVQMPRSRRRWGAEYEVVSYGEDVEDHPTTFDALAFIDDMVPRFARDGIDGVTSSSDYPGIVVAAAIAQALGLPGPAPAAVLRCSHKYLSRLAQREVVPEATPTFGLLDPATLSPDAMPLPFPCFVKPVKSWFSLFARRVDSFAELRAFAEQPDVRAHLTEFVAPLNQLIARYGEGGPGGGYLLAEALLAGHQVTVEGYVSAGEVQIVGVVDSVMFPGTISFQRFDYPSRLDAGVQRRMGDVAARAVRHIGLDNALFNVEQFYDPDADRIWIIEINPRICGQFADLYESVDGANTYEVLLALAAGRRPQWQTGAGRHGVAASFPLRVFTDRRVRRVPDARQIEAVQRDFPLTLVKLYFRPGERLSEGEQDGASYRYATINLAASDHPTLLATFEEVRRRLGFELEEI